MFLIPHQVVLSVTVASVFAHHGNVTGRMTVLMEVMKRTAVSIDDCFRYGQRPSSFVDNS